MKNDYLDYYGEHNISPVKQDISDIRIHYERRKKLYRQCGIPAMAFRNAEVLEVGPGGGYNTLAFFHWNVRHIDLVEANPKGIADMEKLFSEQNISQDKYEIIKCKIEDYKTDKKYDIIIAEGFLPAIYNQQEVINKLSELTASDGIIVITCVDDIGFYIEIMKRLAGVALTVDMQEYNRKLEYLTAVFEPQLAKLEGVSRTAREWVQDQILNPANVNGAQLTMLQAIYYFGENYDVLGTSPQMFTDYSWYKDIWYDYKKDYEEQFHRKRLSLLQTNMPEVVLAVKQGDILAEHFECIRHLEAEFEKTYDVEKISKIIEEMDFMEESMKQNLDTEFMKVFCEIRELLLCILNKENITMENYPSFFAAFGRAQQYISFVKR